MNKKNNKALIPALVLALGLSALAPFSTSYAADTETETAMAVYGNKEDEIKAAEQTVEELEEQVNEAEGNLKTAEENLEAKKSEKDHADQRVETAKNDLNEKSKAKDQADQALREAEEKQDKANDEYIDILEKQADQQQANADVVVAEAELENAKSNQSAADEAINAAENEVTDAKKALETYKDSLEKAQQNLDELKAEDEIENIAGEYGKAKLDTQDVEDDIRNALKDDYELDEEMDNLDDLEAAEAEIEDAKSNLEVKESDYNNLLDAINNNNLNIETLNEEITDLEAEIDEEEALLGDRSFTDTISTDEFLRRSQELDAKIKKLNAKRDQLKAEEKALNENLSKEASTYDEVQKAQQAVEDAILGNSIATNIRERSNVRFDVLTGKVNEDNVDQAIADANKKAEDSQRALADAKASTEEIRKQLEAAVKQHQSSRNVLNEKGYQERLKKAQENGEDRYGTLAAHEILLNILENEKQQIAELREQLKVAVDTENKLANDLANSKARAKALDDLRGDFASILENDDLALLADDYNFFKEELDLYLEDLKLAQEDLEQAAKLLGEAEKRVDLAEEYLNYIEGKKKTAADKLTEANKKVEEAENQLKEAKDKLPAEPTKEQVDAAKKAREEAKEALEKAKNAADKAKDAHDEALNELNAALEAQKTADENLQAAQAEKDTAESKRDEAQKALADKEIEVLGDGAKEDVEKAKESLQNRLDESKEGADQDLLDIIIELEEKLADKDLLDIIIELEEKLADKDLTVAGLIDLNNQLDQELNKSQNRNADLVKSRYELQKLVDEAQRDLDNTDVSSNGEDLDGTKKWVSPMTRDEFKAAIDAVNEVLADPNASAEDINKAKLELDNQKYYFDNLKFDPIELTESYDVITEELDFAEEEVADDTLELGKRVVLRQGETGEMSIVVKMTYRGSNLVGYEVVSRDITKYPKNTIIRVGFKVPEYTVEEIEVTEDIPYEVTTTDDSNLEEGAIKIEVKGELGKKTIKKSVTYKDGVVDKEEILSEEITKDPVNEIVRRGIKPSTPEQTIEYTTSTAPIEFVVEEIPDDTLEEGKKVTLREGENGLKSLTHKVVKEEDRVISSEVVKEEITTPAKNKIVRVGTKVVGKTDTDTTDPQTAETELDKAKKAAKDEIDKLSKLTDADKDYYKSLVDKADKQKPIDEVVDRAKKLEDERNKVGASKDDSYLNEFLSNLLELSKLTDNEKADYENRMSKAKTNAEIYQIYDEAVSLNNSRTNKTVNPSKPDDSEEPNPGKADDSEESNPSKPDDSEESNPGKADDSEESNPGKADESEEPDPGKADDSEEADPGKPEESEEPNPGKADDSEESNPSKPDDSEESNPEKPDDSEESNPGKADDSEESNPGKTDDSEEPDPGKADDSEEADPEKPDDSEESNPGKADDSEEADPEKPDDSEESDPGKTGDSEEVVPTAPVIIRPVVDAITPIVSPRSYQSLDLEAEPDEDLIYVHRGYKTIKAGYYSKAYLRRIHDDLRKEVIKLNNTLKSIDLLIEKTPHIANAHKEKLESLINDARKLILEAKEYLVELDEILGLDDDCRKL